MDEEIRKILHIKKVVEEFAAKHDVDGKYLPFFGHAMDGYCVRINDDGYWYGCGERGNWQEIVQKKNEAELMYHIFSTASFHMAGDYELKHRDPGKDFRRIMFSKQVEYLSRMSAEWAKRQSEYHSDILREHPFVDRAG